MISEELQYVDELKKEISRLEIQVKNLTEEKEQSLALAWKYLNKYVEENDLEDEVMSGIKELFNKGCPITRQP